MEHGFGEAEDVGKHLRSNFLAISGALSRCHILEWERLRNRRREGEQPRVFGKDKDLPSELRCSCQLEKSLRVCVCVCG